MKKSILLMAGLVGLALTSCKEDNSLGTMQKNEAPVVVPADGVALQSRYASTGNKINLQNFEESQVVPLVDIELTTQFPENMTVTGVVEIADNSDFNRAQTIQLSSVEASSQNAEVAAALEGETRSLEGYVSALEWNNAFVSFYGLNPATNVNYLRYKLWLSDGKQNIILYNNNGEEYFDAMEFDVTPFDAKLDVNSTYYLQYIVNGQPGQTTVEMYHNPANHVYDDPNFNAMVEVGEGETVYWWITTDEIGSNPYGVEGEDPFASEGNLGKITGNDQFVSGQINVPGVYKVDVNMLELTYTVKIAPNSLYVMYSGGKFDEVAQLGSSDFVNFDGMAGILNKWVLTGQSNYKPTLYVGDPDVEETVDGNLASGALMFSTDGATGANDYGIAYGGRAGLFYVTANLSTLKYTRYYVSSLGFVGTINNWGNKNDDGSVTPDVPLYGMNANGGATTTANGSRSTLFMNWIGNVTLKAGDEWKIRANSEWTVDFGGANGGDFATDGTPVELSKGGANFVATEDGTYTVKVYFKRQYDSEKKAMTPYYMEVTPAK